MAIWCLFEQSGTLKNVLLKRGYKDVCDVDIVDNDNVDVVIDLLADFNKIGLNTFNCFVENNILNGDVVFCFFPCIRFSWTSNLLFKCNNRELRKLSDIDKINYSSKYFDEFVYYYKSLLKFIYFCLERNIKLIVENPYDKNNNYLLKFLPFNPSIIIDNRCDYGDYFEKGTMFYFFNCQPSYFLSDYYYFNDNPLKISSITNNINRSIISPVFFENFINIHCKEVLADENS